MFLKRMLGVETVEEYRGGSDCQARHAEGALACLFDEAACATAGHAFGFGRHGVGLEAYGWEVILVKV